MGETVTSGQAQFKMCMTDRLHRSTNSLALKTNVAVDGTTNALGSLASSGLPLTFQSGSSSQGQGSLLNMSPTIQPHFHKTPLMGFGPVLRPFGRSPERCRKSTQSWLSPLKSTTSKFSSESSQTYPSASVARAKPFTHFLFPLPKAKREKAIK